MGAPIAMNINSYRPAWNPLPPHHVVRGLMPSGASAMPAEPPQMPAGLVERLQAASEREGRRGQGAPIATFNAPQPAAHRAATVNYPPQIDRASIDALPALCGVYVFRGANDMPLYVGRSINVRSRVLAHLRDYEAQLLVRQTRRIEYRRAAGELGAALIERSLIRQLRPPHNRKQRENRVFTLRLNPAGQPQVIQVEERDFSNADNLFGIFASGRAAREALQKLVEQYGLCGILTGLEDSPGEGMACFGRQIRRCQGACSGEEPYVAHQTRLMAALADLRILSWPYAGAMGIVELADGWRQVHVIDHWCYLGSLDDSHRQLPAQPASCRDAFDLYSYKAIIKPYLLGRLELHPLSGAPLWPPSDTIGRMA